MTQAVENSNYGRFTKWAKSQRHIHICDGIAPGWIGNEGQGSGIFAKRTIKAGEQLVFVPASALLTTDNVVTYCAGDNGHVHEKTLLKNTASVIMLPPPSCSAHALLAAYLTRTSTYDELAAWRATWPQDEDLRILPARWNRELREMLPGEATSLAHRQRRRIEEDWELMREWIAHDKVDVDDSDNVKSSFEYHWHIINTRTFYWPYADKLTKLREAQMIPKTWISDKDTRREASGSSKPKVNRKKRRLAKFHVDISRPDNDAEDKKRPSEECLAMCPWADLFNHTDEGFASVTYDKRGYTVTASRGYEKGEEIYVNYGAHGNDFLLAEYGFILPSNTDDSHNQDTLILPHLTPKQESVLRDSGYYGKYNLSPKPPHLCFRTHALLKLLALCPDTETNVEQTNSFQPYHNFINTANPGSPSERRIVADKALKLLFEVMSEKCKRIIALLEKEEVAVVQRSMEISRLNCDGQVDDGYDEAVPSNAVQKIQKVQKTLLRDRWVQISQMVATAMQAARREIEIVTSERNDDGDDSGLFA